MSGEAIYRALTQKDGRKVRELCQGYPEGPFLALTQRRDSVLQKALYSRQVDLVLDLLADAKQRWQHDFHKKLGEHVNIRKNNILHVAATHDSCIQAAIKILEYADHLITSQNDVGESPILLAVRVGLVYCKNNFKFNMRREPCENDGSSHPGYESISLQKSVLEMAQASISNTFSTSL
ncbi:hypothetical protein POM88_012365 [Heracleum sosnowskyi]|uniref:Uncharacterized protein n=1 Tax=Heracleum sosnowskyi TaxID=360622 RepID=A0AAD8IWC9_9APIA|nr:hypothetical protein POM88_012365 [Heracleum sosnowskyi]